MRVVVLALDGVFDSGLSAVLDTLRFANAMRHRIPNPPPPWHVETAGFGDTVRTGAGHTVDTEPIDLTGCDLLLIPAVPAYGPDAVVEYAKGPATAEARHLLRTARSSRTPIATACAGTFLLAEAGVLTGLRATTTWWLAPLFRRHYPDVILDQSTMVTTCDDITTAGAAFGHVDLAPNLVRRRSPALSDLVANLLVIDQRPSQAAHTMLGTLAASDPTVAAFERWARDRIDQPLSIAEAARALGISERTLQRTTQSVLGTSPVRFIQDLRIEQATHLLRTTDLPIETIAHRVGYENAGTLRALLRKRTGSTTRHHRAKETG